MLCKLQEDGRPKCDQYWPDENEVLEYDELGFKIKSESELIQSDNLHKREMTLTVVRIKFDFIIIIFITIKSAISKILFYDHLFFDLYHFSLIEFFFIVKYVINNYFNNNNLKFDIKSISYKEIISFNYINTETNEEISKVVQIQYLGWPDHGIPNKKQIDDFEVTLNQTLEEYNRIVNDNTQQKIVIHWSAGIGRTGTLLTLLHIIANLNKMIQEEKKIESISIFSTLRKLREHRFNLVQSSSQYLFLYEYLSKYLKKAKLI